MYSMERYAMVAARILVALIFMMTPLNTPQQIAEIEEQLLPGFETGVLKPPPIEIVPFEKAVDAYSRVASRQAKAKQVLSFDWRD